MPGDHADPIQIDVVYHADVADAGLDDWLAAQVRRAVEICGLEEAQLTFAIVADDEMAELHEQYTGVAGTTDVLTFDLAEEADAAAIEGDIILCIDEATRQAESRNHDTRHELLLYAIHGLMHLLGEDDHTDEDYQRMHAREDALLKQMGVGPLFDPDRKSNP